MHAIAGTRSFGKLALVAIALLLAACSGDGPESIANEPATPLPTVAPGFCDPINFELECSSPEVVNFNGGATIIADNPDPSGINTSDLVAQMQKFPDEVFGGTLLNLEEPIDFSEGESYAVKVWSPRPVTVSFKLEEQDNPAGGLTVDQDHSGGGSWEELCFDFTGQAVPPPVVAQTIIFDNGTLGQADTDPDNWTFYYDDITQLESCADAGGAIDIQPDSAVFSSGRAPDLVIPDDYAERTPLSSGSVIDPDFADDETFSPVLSVFSGTDSGANIAQVGFIGFPEGFLARYETVDFKVKGAPGFVIFVKLYDGFDALRLNLTSSSYSSELSDGWFQLSIPVDDFAGADQATGIVFESDDSAAMEFRMLLNDIGFSGTGSFVPADPGVVPEVSLYDRDGAPDLVIPDDFAEISVFGSGAVIDDNFRGDLDFRPALAITTGFGFDIWNAQLAYLGFDSGFGTVHETLDFKVKGLSGDVIRVKFLNDPDPPYLDINVTASAFATPLGNGWHQVSVPVTEFEGIATATDLLFETIAPAPAESFTYLLTDVGFSGAAALDTTTSVGFEGDTASFSFDNFGGGESTVIANPDQSGINPSGQVVQMTRTSESDFGGSTLALPAGVDWTQGEIFRMKVWSQREVPVLFKAEGTPAVERSDTHDGGSLWQELCFDFTGDNAGPPVAGISIFFDLGAFGDVANDPDNWTFFYDDIRQTSEPCPVPPPAAPEFTTITFDDPATTYTLTDFGGAASAVTNDPAGGPNQVVLTVKSTTAQAFAGTTVSTLPGDTVPAIPLDVANTRMSVRVFSPDAGIPVRLKIEDASDNAISVETEALTSTVNAWETLIFDFANEAAGTPAFDPAASYNKVSIFFNFGTDGATAGDKSYYFDDIAVAPGDGASGGVELLTNGDFEASATDKAPWLNAGGVATNNFYTADALDGQQVFETNLSQVAVITQGTEYVLAFRARASVARDMIAGIGLNGAPFTADTATVPLTTQWQSYSFNLTAVADIGTAESRVLFDMGGVTSTVNIDDVSLTPADGGAGLLTNGDFEASATDKAPWLNAGGVATNNFYTADALDGQQVFETNLSQVAVITQGTEYVLAFRARASVARDMIAGIGLNGAPFTADTATVPLTTQWQSYSFNLTAVADIGTAESRVLFDMGGVTSTVNIDDVSLTEATAGGGGGGAGGGAGGTGELAVNGGFETGDLAGWEASPNGGTITTTTDSSTGSFAANLNITAAGNPTLKAANLGAGALTPGQQVTVSFDWKGSDANGGVIDIRLFSELSGGGVSATEIIREGAGFPADWTSVGPLTITTGPDVSGGVSLQFTAICGAVAGCVSDISIDNVSIVTN